MCVRYSAYMPPDYVARQRQRRDTRLRTSHFLARQGQRRDSRAFPCGRVFNVVCAPWTYTALVLISGSPTQRQPHLCERDAEIPRADQRGVEPKRRQPLQPPFVLRALHVAVGHSLTRYGPHDGELDYQNCVL